MEEELIRTLQATLEPNASVILAAQNHLEQHLHQQPQAGLSLVNIVHGGPAIPLAIRQAAAVNLSLWIKQRWGPFFTEFVGFPASDGRSVALSAEDKEPVRQALLNSVSLDEVKLRGPMIKALVNIASCDWPDEFPSLLPRVQELLTIHPTTAEGLVSISGALSFLDDWFYNSMDETGLMYITRDILPDLERILTDSKLYPAPVRCRCISIFNQMLETLWMVKEQYPDASKTVAAEIMPRWLNTLESIIAPSPVHQIDQLTSFGQAQGEELALQAQAWLTLATATHFPAHIKSRLSKLISTAMSVLSALQTPFHLFHISSSAIETATQADTTPDFYSSPASLGGRIIDFVGVALQSYTSLAIGGSTLPTLVPLLRSYSRITSEEEEEWQMNVSAFVAAGEEDDAGAMATAMRGRCADILSELMLVKEQEVLEALRLAVTAAHEEGSLRRQKDEADWWKEEEASLSLVGGIAEHIVEKLEDAKDAGHTAPFDVESIFALSVLPNIKASSPYFLYGRCFVFASQFASILPQDLATNFLEAAVGALEQDASGDGGAIVKLSAVRCIKNFHRHLSQAILRPFSARILSRLGPLLDASSEDTLVLIVETLQAVAMQGDTEQSIPPSVYGDIVSECIRAWAKEASDRVLQTTIEDLLEAYAAHKSNPTALAVVQRAFTLCAGLLSQEQSAQEDKYRSSVIVEGSLEFAGAVARGATADVLTQSGAVLPFLMPLFETLSKSDDREVYKNAAVLLTNLISKMPDEIMAWHDDARGVTSLQHILILISNMISPQDASESGGLAVGDLLTIILRRKPEALASTLPQLCTALASRLATSASTSLTQSLIVPLAYLMKDHLDTVIVLLQAHGVSVDDHVVPSLDVLLRRWCEFAGSFQGFWNTRVSSLGLCAILKQAKQSGIDNLSVDGDLIPDNVNIIKTRSRAKLMPNRYTQIPASAKILKILVNEYTQSVDGPPSQAGKGGGLQEEEVGFLDHEDDDDDDDDEWNDDEDFVKKQKRSALLAGMGFDDGDIDGGFEDVFAQADEEQYRDDAIYNMPFRSYLIAFFKELAQDGERATQLASHLTRQEVTILQSAIA